MSLLEESKVQIGVTHGDLAPFMGYYHRHMNLDDFIQERCVLWNLSRPSDYMLQFPEPPCHYISQTNAHLIKKGALLTLVRAAPLVANDVLITLKLLYDNGDSDKASNTLSHLAKIATCPTFVHHFAEIQGFESLLSLMLKLPTEDTVLPLLLQVFADLMNTARGIPLQVTWDMCSYQFIEKLILVVHTQLRVPGVLLTRSLIVLENIVSNGSMACTNVEKSINILQLMSHLYPKKNPPMDLSVHSGVQRAVLSLIVALINRSEYERRNDYYAKLSERKYRTYITDNVLLNLKETNNTADEVEIKKLLHKLQQFLLNHLRERLMTGVTTDDSDATDKILELRTVAFETDVDMSGSSSKDSQAPVARRMEIKKEYKKLGFKNENPANDFNEVPPGILALENMYYFCRNRSDLYSKLVLENCYRADSHECPIGKASIELTKELAKILKIGELPRENCTDFHPMLFTNDHPFEEMFCICIGLLNKTWKEMKATTEDFNKVVRVVREQIERALRSKPKNFDSFNDKLQQLTYAKISEFWHNERLTTEREEMKAPQIQKLRDDLKIDILEVVQQQRLKVLEAGGRFRNPNKSQKRDKYFFCRLSPNHKFFHYEECEEKATVIPPLDSLHKKCSVADIKSLATGKECPNHKKYPYAFSLILESGKVDEPSSLDFAAQNEEVFSYWHDGIKVLLRENMSSDSAVRDVNMLLDMEVKLQLLDVEGVAIPTEMPPIPPLPPNYNFCQSA